MSMGRRYRVVACTPQCTTGGEAGMVIHGPAGPQRTAACCGNSQTENRNVLPRVEVGLTQLGTDQPCALRTGVRKPS